MNEVSRFHLYEARFHGWLARNSIPMTRFALGVVFFWFGVLKFFPHLSPAQDLAGKTILHLTGGRITPNFSLPILAMWECTIGAGLLFAQGRLLRLALILLALQMPGTFMPLIFFPQETWTRFPYAPTLEGQYIIKNLVLIGAGWLVGGTMYGGKVITDPKAALEAEKKQNSYYRFRKRFRKEPDAKRK